MTRSFTWTKVLLAFIALAMIFSATPMTVSAQSIGISVSFGPPPIPYYVQPPAPDPNYLWSPGYWAYDPMDGYYWVPGTWVPAPRVGYLWTPSYWAWNGSAFVFSTGYWARQVGWYGGVNYGYGYYGHGYNGGRWHGNHFEYNTAVTHVNRYVVHNVYIDRSVVNNHWNRVSYNGGRGGVQARPSARELAVQHGNRIQATSVQMQHARVASTNRAYSQRVNHGRPATAAVARPFTAYHAPQHAAAAPQVHHAAAAPMQHAYAAPRHVAAPVQHAAPAPHYAPQQQRMVAPQHMAAPTAHVAPHAAPAAHGAQPGDRREDHHDDHR